jgi:hypothetical protein
MLSGETRKSTLETETAEETGRPHVIMQVLAYNGKASIKAEVEVRSSFGVELLVKILDDKHVLRRHT